MVATSTPLRDEYCKGVSLAPLKQILGRGELPGVSIITGDAGDCAKSGLVRCHGQVGFCVGQACRDKRPRSRSRIRVNTGLLVTALVAMCMQWLNVFRASSTQTSDTGPGMMVLLRISHL
ncbi:hypothetical protein BJY52DRAFT_1226414 [Lactarius psammicola]|nr:hypothetical protein BJY52DRAFT_1226414 [Lactarius psammicola]